MRLALVTSCRQAGGLLRDTVGSVLSLDVPTRKGVSVDYTVVDAASDDGTLAYLRSISAPAWMRFTFTSERDDGLYDGLVKGFSRVTGDWFGYVNAGDMVGPGLVRTLGLVSDQHPDVEWVTGLRLLHGHSGRLLNAELPFRYRGDLLARGVYGRTLLPSVQQEATFWSSRLMATVMDDLASFHLAGDIWMWSRFAAALPGRRHPLTVVRAHTGGYRAHAEHLSRGGRPSDQAPDPGLGGKRAYLAEAAERIGAVRRRDRWRAHLEVRRWGRITKLRRHQRQDTLVLSDDETVLVRRPLPARREVTPLLWAAQAPGRLVRRRRIAPSDAARRSDQAA